MRRAAVLAVNLCVHVRADFAAQLQAVRGHADVFVNGSLQECLVAGIQQGATNGAIWHVLQAEARGDQVVFYLGTLAQQQRLAGNAGVVFHHAPDLHRSARGDEITLHGTVHCDGLPERHEVAPDRAVDNDVVGSNVEVIVDHFVGANHTVSPLRVSTAWAVEAVIRPTTSASPARTRSLAALSLRNFTMVYDPPPAPRCGICPSSGLARLTAGVAASTAYRKTRTQGGSLTLFTENPRRVILGNPERPAHSYHCTRLSPSCAGCTVAGAGARQNCQSKMTNPIATTH